jgi:hypothetical protein
MFALIALVVIGGVLGSLRLQGMLRGQVTAADHANIDADISSSQLDKAKVLQSYLNLHADDVKKAADVVAQAQTYQYQNQIVEDINSYASKAGVSILGFTFPDPATNRAKQAGGLKTVQATIALKNPVDYRHYLRFLKLIEQNLTKMQITDVTLTPDSKVTSQIDAPTIGLEVYVK